MAIDLRQAINGVAASRVWLALQSRMVLGIGYGVAAALTGTLLGIFVAYGFVSPLAIRIKFNNGSEEQYLKCIMQAVSGFAKGLAPLTAVEVARRSLDSSVQPGAEELETAVKNLGK